VPLAGEVAEWSKANDSKSFEGQPSVGSNPTLSVDLMLCCLTQRFPFRLGAHRASSTREHLQQQISQILVIRLGRSELG
jgi:hypothetical protein